MKKLLIIMLTILMTLCLFGCGEKNNNNNNNTNPVNDNPGQSDVNEDPKALKEPDMYYWMVKTNTGIPVFVGKIRNDNKVAVDITFNIEFLKEGKSIITMEDWYYNCLPAGQEGFIWFSWDTIPKEADQIKITYTYLDESYYTPLTGKTIKNEPSPIGRHIEFDTDKSYSCCIVTLICYRGDKIVEFECQDIFPGMPFEYDCELIETYDSCEILYNIYK